MVAAENRNVAASKANASMIGCSKKYDCGVVSARVSIGEQREQDRGDERHAVRRDQRDLVGGLELLAGHQVGDRRLLGRDPEQAEDLDRERRREQVGQGGHDDDRGHQRGPDQVAEHHLQAPVEPVGEGTGERAEEHRRQQPRGQHGTGGEQAAAVAADQRSGEGRSGQQPEPVAEAGQPQCDPQPPERGDGQRCGQLVRGQARARDVTRIRDGRLRRHGTSLADRQIPSYEANRRIRFPSRRLRL